MKPDPAPLLHACRACTPAPPAACWSAIPRSTSRRRGPRRCRCLSCATATRVRTDTKAMQCDAFIDSLEPSFTDLRFGFEITLYIANR
jgi:coenzyme PQQ precursor peptide PqqA